MADESQSLYLGSGTDDAKKLQGFAIFPITPTNGYSLVWSGTLQEWIPAHGLGTRMR